MTTTVRHTYLAHNKKFDFSDDLDVLHSITFVYDRMKLGNLKTKQQYENVLMSVFMTKFVIVMLWYSVAFIQETRSIIPNLVGSSEIQFEHILFLF